MPSAGRERADVKTLLSLLTLAAASSPLMAQAQSYTLMPQPQNITPMARPQGIPLDTTGRSISLADAIRLAQQVQPNAVSALGTLQNAQAAVRTANGEWLPNLTGTSSAGGTYRQVPGTDPNGNLVPGGQTTRTINAGLSTRWDVFTGFRRGADENAAVATRTAAEAGLLDARWQTAYTATNQFLLALAARQLLRVRQASVQRAQEQLTVSVNKLKAGSATRSDSLRSLVSLGQTQLQLITAMADLVSQEAELGRLVGVSGRVGAEDDSSFYQVPPLPDAQALLQEATEQSPRVRNTEAALSAARAQLSAAKSGYWPTLALTANTQWNGNNTSFDYHMFNQSSVTLGLSWNIFDRFTREQTITNRDAALITAEANAADARHEIESQLTAAYASLQAARVGIDIANTSLAAAQEDLRVQKERYRLGVATIIDQLLSEESLTQAEVDVVTARFTYLRATAQIEALIGRTL
jgi:outer membrane protein